MSALNDQHRTESEDWSPLDRGEHRAQLIALKAMLPRGSRVLDLGCGSGRMMMPLIRAGMRVVGVDRDRRALRAARRRLNRVSAGRRATLMYADLPHEPPVIAGDFDAVICLGHTFMEIIGLEEALHVLRWASWRLRPGGAIVLDDLPALWREVADGHWQSGVSEDGESQLVWEPARPVFTLRSGAAVDADNWTVGEHDRRFRLWTIGELALLARLARLSPPERDLAGGLLLLSRPHDTP